MGSPGVSVVVANLVMEVLETKAIDSFQHSPRVYKRYVDDTLCIMDKDQIDAFHSHLNRQNQHISFTVERYSDSGLPFLDTLNKVLEDGTIDITIYRKNTHTDRYLSCESHHAPRHKSGVRYTPGLKNFCSTKTTKNLKDVISVTFSKLMAILLSLLIIIRHIVRHMRHKTKNVGLLFSFMSKV